MDKEFLLNAFKSLDEIIDENKKFKKSLRENHSLDFDEFEQKYLHQRGVVNSGDHIDSLGEITQIKDFGKDFNDSVFEFTLDTGIKLTLEGKDISLELQEKIPGDLYRAYKKFRRKAYTTSDIFPSRYDMSEFHTPGELQVSRLSLPGRRDFENASYTEISKKEALKNYAAKDTRYMLRVLIGDTVAVWNKKGQLLSRLPANMTNFRDIIDAATKVYVADEPLLPQKSRNLTDEEKQLLHDADVAYNGGGLRRAGVIAYNTVMKSLNSDPYQHLGVHRDNYYKSRVKSLEKTYANLLEKAKHPVDEIEAKAIARRLCTLKVELENVRISRAEERRNSICGNNLKMNIDLARFILYKFLYGKAKIEAKKLLSSETPHEYTLIQNNIKKVESRIAELQEVLRNLQSQLTPQLLDDYNDYVSNACDNISNELDRYEAVLNSIKKNKDMHESVAVTKPCSYKIYVKNTDGQESFDSENINDKESAIARAKDLLSDDNYEEVVVCCICGDDVEILWSKNDLEEDLSKPSIGEIVDARIKNEAIKSSDKNTLTESKKFNLTDADDVENAKIYKEIGDKTAKALYVVDPVNSLSEDELLANDGKAVLQCKTCKICSFKDLKDLIKEENLEDTYNLKDECLHCGANTGYNYLGIATNKHIEDKPIEHGEKVDDVAAEEVVTPLVAVEDNFSDIDSAEELQEESFEKLIDSYATKLYENIDSYKLTDVKQLSRKTFILEGVLKGKNGKEINSDFTLNLCKNTSNSILFEGYNKLLTGDDRVFNFNGKIVDNKLIFDSMNYKYEKLVDGNKILVDGVEKN